VGFASQFLPWVPVTRATFIYHFFPSVPFIVLALALLLNHLEEDYKQVKWVRWGLMALCLVLFIWFYPILSGTLVNKAYAQTLAWFPGWSYFYG
jgi:dolichyl-phosphate-mannose--protein O-mannosyl transferase